MSDRNILAAFLILLWAIRLTYNYGRKGGYKSGHEDYRWPVLRSVMPRPVYAVFNLVFIATYQNVLLLLICMPLYVCCKAAMAGRVGLQVADFVIAGVFLLLLLGETVADQQQWNFQQEKHRRLDAKEPLGPEYAHGFIRTGLFRYSRHPNFFCEISIWWCIFFFARVAAGNSAVWSGTGAVLLTLLFQGSTAFTEYISKKKYPLYKEYCADTSRLIPWLPAARKHAD